MDSEGSRLPILIVGRPQIRGDGPLSISSSTALAGNGVRGDHRALSVEKLGAINAVP